MPRKSAARVARPSPTLVLLEDMNRKFDVLIEGQKSMEGRLLRYMDDRFEKLEARDVDLEVAVIMSEIENQGHVRLR